MDRTTPQNLASVQAAAPQAGCSERLIWYLLARGDLTRYKSLSRTYVDVDQLAERLRPRPVD